jgi:hypothetical protein
MGELDWSRVTALVEVDFAERRFLRAYEILDAGPPRRSRLKGIDAGYMLAALFFLTLLLAMNA